MGFADWSISVRILIICINSCITIPSMALYIAEIVTIVRHKKFHNSFYALFVMRAIPDLLYVLDSFYGDRLPSIIGAVLCPIYSKFPNWMLAMFYFISGHTYQANNLGTAFILLNRLTAIIMPIKHEKIWKKFLPFIIIFVYLVPALMCWPMFKLNAILILKDQNSNTDRSFIVFEAGDAPFINYLIYINAAFSAIFLILCVILNICTFVAYKLHVKKVDINGGNNVASIIEKKLMIYALATFLSHMLVASLFLISIMNILNDAKTKAMLFVYYPLIMDTATNFKIDGNITTGTVVLSSWLLLWASGTFRQQLINDFAIIRIQNNRVDAMEEPRNNNHRPVGGSVGHQLQNTIYNSEQQLPAIS